MSLLDPKNWNVFVRNWWKKNATWPNGLEPEAGKRRYIARGVTLEEARRLAQEYNATHRPGRLSRKAEIENTVRD